jgi:hypothetical protein
MSQMIQHATDSHWSHVGVIWRLDHLDRILVLESVESIGVRAISLSQYVNNYNHTGKPYPGTVCIARHRGFPVDAPTPFGQEVVDLLGTFYDTREIASIALRIMGHKLGFGAKPPTNNRLLICSEFAEVIYKSVGIVVPYDPRGFIAPRDWAECPQVDLLWHLAT